MGLYLFQSQDIVVSGILHLYAFSLPPPYLLLTFSLPTPLQSLRYGKEVDSRKYVQGVGMDGRF